MAKVFDLLIVFTNDQRKTIRNVSSTSYSDEMFTFDKNGYRAYLPRENIKYFGRLFDWGGE